MTHFFYLVVFALLIACTPQERYPEGLFGQENAVWTESIFFRGHRPSTGELLTDQYINDYAQTVKENNINYAYIFSGPFGTDGHLPEYAFSETAVNSVERLKRLYPEIVILPWVGGLQNKTVYLGDSLWVANALKDTQKLVEVLDIPGVHVDFEFILSGDPYLEQTVNPEKPGDRDMYGHNVNEFHSKLRALLPTAFISSVVIATSPDTRPWKRKTSMDELHTLIKYVDQLSFLYFDTHLHDQQLFEKNCVDLIRDIHTLKQSQEIQYLISVGTFLNVPELRDYRDMEIERISNTLKTIKRSAVKVDSVNRIVDGISIYSDWTTDKSEWHDFRRYWVE